VELLKRNKALVCVDIPETVYFMAWFMFLLANLKRKALLSTTEGIMVDAGFSMRPPHILMGICQFNTRIETAPNFTVWLLYVWSICTVWPDCTKLFAGLVT
jgi:hypothetical protein